MNGKTAKKLRKLAKIKEQEPGRQRKFYQNAKIKFKSSNVWMKTQLNKLLKATIAEAA